ncbi:ABC transporter substrate-binding protein [Paenibacillus xerothermodurans]|uniref:ABC transporter substrate-binding protein n=1 Tax=Paenibacillus xerothermodurans TaxID=1977292 RepID=A0A2W1NUZ9_PAEXE|nr:ABC transporter substrate-binding protein [Paenibacillus xerothermodurans]PZE19512.1 ABC transporter substrate-binding protein [Paenibacillus xerothermodurans]
MKRSFVTMVVCLLLFMTISGCFDPPADDTTAVVGEKLTDAAPQTASTTEVSGGTMELKQAPMLDGRNLPPIQDRLPAEVKVTNEMPADMLKYEIGTYGGTLRTVTSAVGWDADVFVMNNEPLLNTPGILGTEITGNVLLGYTASEDGKSFDFQMRKGLKWSDGTPVTTEDVRFSIEDMLFNEELTPVFPAWLKAGGKAEGSPLSFKVVDEYSFQITFDQPYGGFPIRLAIESWRGYSDYLLKPAHFLKPFHKKYADAKVVEAAMKEGQYGDAEWAKFFNDKDVTSRELTKPAALGFPVLYPWVMVKMSDTTTEYERNPYYFKVDAKGNQLPYIDKIQSALVQNIEMVTMKTIAGEVDFSRESAALIKMPLYKENEQKGGYRTLLSDMHVTPTDIFLNLTYADPVWRQVVQDVRFRQALSLALNREEIIDTIYYGFAEPAKIMDSTFNLDEANKLLDEMGMKRGPDGFRVGPDGKKFTVPFEIGAQAPDIVPLTQLIVEFWKNLGLDVTMKTIDQTLWTTRRDANEIQATMMWTHTPLWYMADWGQSFWGRLWKVWLDTGGQQGEEPPADVKRLYDLIDKVAVSPPQEAITAIEEVKKEMSKNAWYFVHIENVKQPLIVNAKLGNIPEKGFAIAADFSGEQFFFKQ